MFGESAASVLAVCWRSKAQVCGHACMHLCGTCCAEKLDGWTCNRGIVVAGMRQCSGSWGKAFARSSLVESHGPTLEANLQHQSVHQRSCISRPAQASPSVWMFKTRIVMIDVSQAWQCSDHGPHGVADSLGRPGPCTT